MLLIFTAFFASVVIRTAWVADAAFVDLRTVANFAGGHGLTWNTDERVQAFADPLWVLMLSSVTYFVSHPYVAVLIASIALSVGSVTILATRVAVDSLAALVGIAVLTFSRAFVEYSTSGFQTPLVFMLLAVFWAVYVNRPPERRTAIQLLVIASLCVLTDWTAVLLIAPALIASLKTSDGWRAREVFVGLSPVLLWVLFAQIYFDDVVPAPLIAAIQDLGPPLQMLRQGGVYLLDAIDRDPLTVVAIGGAAVAGFRIRQLRLISGGIILFIVALVASGGDVMSGRALAPVLLSAVVIVVRHPWRESGNLIVLPLCGVAAIGLITPDSPVLAGPTYGPDAPLTQPWPGAQPTIASGRAAILDARRQSYGVTGLLTMQRTAPMPDTIALQREAEGLSRQHRVVVDARTGLFAYAAGPRLHIVDPSGRTDPVLAARSADGPWTPGPRRRSIPEGYVAALERRQAPQCPSNCQ